MPRILPVPGYLNANWLDVEICSLRPGEKAAWTWTHSGGRIWRIIEKDEGWFVSWTEMFSRNGDFLSVVLPDATACVDLIARTIKAPVPVLG